MTMDTATQIMTTYVVNVVRPIYAAIVVATVFRINDMPLSNKLRPKTLDEFVGQTHFLYKGSLFYNLIKEKKFRTALFYGATGSGKTSLARIIANEIDSEYKEINAAQTGIKELKAIIEIAKKDYIGLRKKRTFLYIDEFHRWNKLQQDALLKPLEDGYIYFIGATTENPVFSINNAILSRISNIYEFKCLTKDELIVLIKKGLAEYDKKIEDKEISLIADLANGDGRLALNKIELIMMSSAKKIDGKLIFEAFQKKIMYYDRIDDKYDLYSALQKSIRGSDVDAALHYLARLIEGGEDVMSVGRRLLVIPVEDISLAYANAIVVVMSAFEAAKQVGFPEARIHFAFIVCFLSSLPKSNTSYMAYEHAKSDLEKFENIEVPKHLKNNPLSVCPVTNRFNEKKEIKSEYKYPHDFGGYVNQDYLPEELVRAGVKYFNPIANGQEKIYKKYLEDLKKK